MKLDERFYTEDQFLLHQGSAGLGITPGVFLKTLLPLRSRCNDPEFGAERFAREVATYFGISQFTRAASTPSGVKVLFYGQAVLVAALNTA